MAKPNLWAFAGVAAVATTGACGPPAHAQTAAQKKSGPEFSANIALVSDYVVRGVSFSDHQAAVQGGFDVVDPSGWSAGVWASPIDEYNGSTVEVDLYAAKSFTVAETEFSLGVTAFLFPDGRDTNVGEAQASAARAIGPVDVTVAANYAWEQANLGDLDSIYLSLGAVTPVGRLAGAPIAVSASVGYEDGAFAGGGDKVDWSVGVTADIHGVTFGVSYTDNDLGDARGDPAAVFSISRTF